MGKIVIFGATGTVGVYTSLKLKEDGYDVLAVGRRKSDNGFFGDYDIPYASVDIVNKNAFDVLPQRDVDCVIHYAGSMPARMKGYNPQEYIDTIITGTLNVLEYTRKAGAKKIVFTQSISDCFWMVKDATPIPADIWRKFPLNNDHSVYVIAKNAAVDLIVQGRTPLGADHCATAEPLESRTFSTQEVCRKYATYPARRDELAGRSGREQCTVYGNA